MLIYELEERKFEELVDPTILPIRKLAEFTGKTQREIYIDLAVTYNKASKEKTLHIDRNGIFFNTEFAEINIFESADLFSKYNYYLRFLLNENFVPMNNKTMKEDEKMDIKNKVFNVINELSKGNEEWLDLADVGNAIKTAGIDFKELGFEKLRLFLEQYSDVLEFSATHDECKPPVYYVKVKNEIDYDDFYPQKQICKNYAFLPESLKDVTYIYDNLYRLNEFVNGTNQMPDEAILNRLEEGYILAKQQDRFTEYEGAYAFDTGLTTKNGEIIEASVKPNIIGRETKGWVLNYVGFKSKNTIMTDIHSSLYSFADMGSDFLNDVENLAIKEKWSSTQESEKKDILFNYLNYTFYKLQKENKICVDEEEGFAAFNTGLATEDYQDIYMCFKTGGGKYKYLGVCTCDRGDKCWKMLIKCFSELPKPASFIEKKEDIVYDMDKKLSVDATHIILDNINRLPIEFLYENLSNLNEALRKLEELKKEVCDDRQIYRELSEIIQNSPDVMNDLMKNIQTVADKTVRMLRWNYRLAIPSYYPKADKMNILIPMYFLGNGKPQAALVVEQQKSGNYIGHTLLTMKQAYLNARLISSQESSWLTV